MPQRLGNSQPPKAWFGDTQFSKARFTMPDRSHTDIQGEARSTSKAGDHKITQDKVHKPPKLQNAQFPEARFTVTSKHKQATE